MGFFPFFFFFFNDTATTEIYTLSLHDALPISSPTPTETATASPTLTPTAVETVVAPPDPATVAPPLDRSVATDIFASTQFLYTGSNAIQTGVASGAIEARRAAVLRGRVLNRDGQALPGVTITVLNHPDFGQTHSRADGQFDLAVNGGGQLTVDYQRSGYLPAQRNVEVP